MTLDGKGIQGMCTYFLASFASDAFDYLSKALRQGGSPGLVVMGRDSPEGCGFESQHRILDGHFSQIFVVKIVMIFV